ncbi:hypothetical protein [Nonomuraea sp. NPDC049684]|uniref:hypothetical protein n=1 Tax=Nonomuraea sp. NPDC049684 TaxID=3364356 RepID=UPI00378CABE5
MSVSPPRQEDSAPSTGARWPGWDEQFPARVRAATARLEMPAPADGDLVVRDGPERAAAKPGPPLCIRAGWREPLERLVAAYHRLIETIVTAYPHDPRLRTVLVWPPGLRPEQFAGEVLAAGRVHVMRLDVMPQPDGALKVLETNANCPAGLGKGSQCARWRPLLTAAGVQVPPPLPGEVPHWLGRWLLQVAEQEMGRRPETVALLRPEGGHRTELDGYAHALNALGIGVVEADPCEMRLVGGRAVVGGQVVECAYAKIGMQDMARLRSRLQSYVRAVCSGALFVPNGLRARLIGDNKLCLAVLSDPRFADLFDPADYALVQGSIPWSRNLATCDLATVGLIRGCPDGYVLKRPLDTRGRGVVVGREAPDWNASVDVALAEGWLVQEYCAAPVLEADDGQAPLRHDLELGAINGRLIVAGSRASREERVNVARSGRTHPVYL